MAGFFSESTLEQIRAASDIVDVIGAVLPLKRAGVNFVALCPFHREKTPSFNVNPQRQIFHCFGCHKGGDVFRFVQEYENLSFVEAVQRLAERARIPLEVDASDGAQQRRFVKDTLLQIHESLTQRWQAVLTHDAAGQLARDYLAKRQVPEEAIHRFRLGAAPEAWDDTVNWARSKGFDLALVEQAGLILRKEGSDHLYDRFRGRLMFPICDEQGRVVAFSGRVLAGDEKTAKYVNSPETPIFTKGRVLYGLDKAKRAILDAGCAVVCEGQLDLIACHMAGVQHVVAPQGTALTAEHARVLRRYVQEVILCFDADNAGRNAAIRALDDLLASGLAVRVAAVPAPHDPDSFIQSFGGEAFRQLLERAQGFFDFYLDQLAAQHDSNTDRGRVAIVRAMGEAVAKTGNAVLADTYAQRTAQRLAVASDAVRTEFRKLSRPSHPAAKQPPSELAPAAPEMIRPSGTEFWLLKLLAVDDSLVAWAAAQVDLEWIQHPGVRHVLNLLLHPPASGPHDVASLVATLPDDQERSLLTEATAERRSIPNRSQQLTDVVKRLRDAHVDRRIADLSREIVRQDLADARRAELLRQQQDLRQLKRTPLPPIDVSSS